MSIPTCPLGRSGLQVSRVSFGCGDNAGLMTGAQTPEQRRSVGIALDQGINLFDTSPRYGGGTSEVNLGSALRQVPDALVSSKLLLRKGPPLATQVRSNATASLTALKRDHIDAYQLHNRVVRTASVSSLIGGLDTITLDEITTPGGIGDELMKLKESGVVRAIGLTAFLGDIDVVTELAGAGLFDFINCSIHLLNPSAALQPHDSWPAHNYRAIASKVHGMGLGVLAIRALGGGWICGDLGPSSIPRHRDSVDSDIAWNPEISNHLGSWISSTTGEPISAALGFVDALPCVSSIVCGFSSSDQVTANIAAIQQANVQPFQAQSWVRTIYTDTVVRQSANASPGGAV